MKHTNRHLFTLQMQVLVGSAFFLALLFQAVNLSAEELKVVPEKDWIELTGNQSIEQGDLVYVDFWASWCIPCRRSFPWLNAMQTKYSELGLKIIAVNLDKNRDDANTFLNAVPADFPIYYDPEGYFASLFKLPGMPTSYILNADGQVLYRHKGFKTKQIEKYESALSQLLKNSD